LVLHTVSVNSKESSIETKLWDIWVEGWAATGGGSKASLVVSKVEAPTFTEAIEKYASGDPKFKKYLAKQRDGTYTHWGCRLFDNEKDARKFLG
jgi:hypothetical protein